MQFIETKIKGTYIIEPDLLMDERGFFARTFCKHEFEANRINPNLVQCNISFNEKRGTFRGMHYQSRPHAEAKLVRCTMGSIYDLIIDLRPDSSTFKQWIGLELKAADRNMLYIPEGLAHGFLTLTDDTEVFYQMSEYYHPECSCGVRWNDPAFGIVLPFPVSTISPKDVSYPDWETQS